MTTEVVSIASVFIGVGVMALFLVMAYWFYQFARHIKSSADLDEKTTLLEILALEGVAKVKGIDMEKIAIERDLKRKKSFRRKLEEEMIKHMFDDKTKESK